MKKEFQKHDSPLVVNSDIGWSAIFTYYNASIDFIDTAMDIVTCDHIDNFKNEISLYYSALNEVIRKNKVTIHPYIYKKICKFSKEFEGLFSDKLVLELKTVEDWVIAVHNVRIHFDQFTDEVLMPYLWG